MTKALNYNTIAPTYNRRFVSDGQRQTGAVLRGLAEETQAQSVLEVGCGTGHWLAGLAGAGYACFGLDRSSGMLAQAAQRPEALHLVHGQAEALPFGGLFELLFCVNAIHHFGDKAAFIHEAWRMLSPGGALAVIGMDPHGKREDWYIYDYFDGTYETDLQRFPAWAEVGAWMEAAGFVQVQLRPVETIYDPKEGRAVLDDPFLQKHAASQLALLSDDAYTGGMRRIHQALEAAEHAGQALTFMSRIQLEMMIGWKP
ncbi:MAG TPA: methyltransferase domain-containing protein [Anaerolineales bacterium]|nr:methyltransferase domain-containing protein [Anaerolineales bacterium]